jgi:HEAT repeat protein
LFYQLAETYYYHAESLSPVEDAPTANVWFWDSQERKLAREAVAKDYFYELMAMRSCEWALKADGKFGSAIGLWIASYFKAESAGVEKMPDYFGSDHADALVYATTAGVEYLHQALARAIRDKNAYVALGVIEALGTTAGEKSLMYRLGLEQPLVQALSFDNKLVRYSAAIAIGSAGPMDPFPESKLVVANLAGAIGQQPSSGEMTEEIADSYALRAATVMSELARTRNIVIDLSLAQTALINAVKDKRTQIQILSGKTLAHLGSSNAQRAIAEMALDADNTNEVRVAAFNSLTTSAKVNANLLPESAIDSIYALIQSGEIDPELRSAAAAAYGALNLPSQKAKDLILDQAKS